MFTGAAPAIITPFTQDLQVDYTSLEKFVRFQLDEKADAIVVLGTTGESPTISFEEREKIVAKVVEVVNKKVPVIVGTGANDAEKIVKWNKSAEKLGADGLLIVTPYYNKSTQKGLITHFTYVAEKTRLPIILYNVPSRTGVNLLPETTVEIAKRCSNVIAMKEASGDISQIAKLIALKPDNFQVFSGNDDQVLPITALGGSGVVSVFSNVCPKEMKEVVTHTFSGDLEKARSVHNKYLPFIHTLFAEVNPIPVKYVLSRMGYCENVLRLPLVPVTEKTAQALDMKMKELAIS